MVSMLTICLSNRFMRLKSDNINVSSRKIDIPSTAVTNAMGSNIEKFWEGKLRLEVLVKIMYI